MNLTNTQIITTRGQFIKPIYEDLDGPSVVMNEYVGARTLLLGDHPQVLILGSNMIDLTEFIIDAIKCNKPVTPISIRAVRVNSRDELFNESVITQLWEEHHPLYCSEIYGNADIREQVDGNGNVYQDLYIDNRNFNHAVWEELFAPCSEVYAYLEIVIYPDASRE